MFDRSPVGLNHWLGFRFRCMLGRHIFRHLGKNVRIFRGVEFTFGYNLTIEDNCTIHKYAMLDDHSELVVPAGSTIPDYARIDLQTRRSLHCRSDDGLATQRSRLGAPTNFRFNPQTSGAGGPLHAWLEQNRCHYVLLSFIQGRRSLSTPAHEHRVRRGPRLWVASARVVWLRDAPSLVFADTIGNSA